VATNKLLLFTDWIAVVYSVDAFQNSATQVGNNRGTWISVVWPQVAWRYTIRTSWQLKRETWSWVCCLYTVQRNYNASENIQGTWCINLLSGKKELYLSIHHMTLDIRKTSLQLEMLRKNRFIMCLDKIIGRNSLAETWLFFSPISLYWFVFHSAECISGKVCA